MASGFRLVTDPCSPCRHLRTEDGRDYCARILATRGPGDYLTGWRRDCPERVELERQVQPKLFATELR